MFHEIPRKMQGPWLRKLLSLIAHFLAMPAIVAVFSLLLIVGLGIPLGQPVSELVLNFVGSAAEPLIDMQLQLLTLASFVLALHFLPCRDWTGVSTHHLTIRQLNRVCELARLVLLAAPLAPAPTGPSSSSTRWLTHWTGTEVRQTPYLSGDHPQLE